MRILFFGTPAFAVPALKKLIENKREVVGVVTRPDRPGGRGLQLKVPPVKAEAQARGLTVLQPVNLKEALFLKTVRSLFPDLAVVVAYGQLFPPPLLELFPQGAINLHASLLPRYRGAAPIPWALIRGETETGVTAFQMDELLDHGPILLQARYPIGPKETTVSLTQALAELGAQTLDRAIDLLKTGLAEPIPQDETRASLAPRLKKEDGIIDWKLPCLEIHNRIRGLQPWPGAITWLKRRALKILSSTPDPNREDPRALPGTVVLSDPKQGFWVQTGKGQLRIDRIQAEGGRILEGFVFLQGHPLPPGTVLTSSV